MKNKYLTFSCGCKFPLGDNNSVTFDTDVASLNKECSKTWDLISDGNTKGCFQLESRLGQSMSKKLKPSNIEQLSGLISILRPGCLEAYREGKSVSNHYIDKKNNLEDIDYFHPSLEDILQPTYGEMIYQEQAMRITQKIAGFDLKEADMLRKAIGKKKPEEMAKVKKRFISGCKEQNIVTREEAEEIFGWIEKSQRYSFNKSHAISYAINAYLSAYAKAHFPKMFFASYLKFAKDKIDPQQEIKELIRNASEMDVSVTTPDLRNLNRLFVVGSEYIYFGLTDIKGVGNSVFNKIMQITDDTDFDINKESWCYLLFGLLLKINSTAVKALISSGALDYLKINRTEMLFQYDVASSLTKKEASICEKASVEENKLKNILENLLDAPRINKNRKIKINDAINMLKKPPYSLQDRIEWLSDSESSLLGAAISCCKLDSYDISMTNTDCRTFKKSHIKNNIIIAGEISGVNIVKTKKGKNPGQEMAFVTIEDSTGLLDSVIMFPESWTQYKHHIFNSNVLVFVGNKTKQSDGFIVEKCFDAHT